MLTSLKRLRPILAFSSRPVPTLSLRQFSSSKPPNSDQNDDLKEMRDALKKEEEKLEGKNIDFEEAKTSESSEVEQDLHEGVKTTQFYVLRFDKPVFPLTTFELSDNKHVNEFSKYLTMKAWPQVMQRLIAVYVPGNKNSAISGVVGTEIVLKKDTNW